jgi:AraC-like DNA-binding protein
LQELVRNRFTRHSPHLLLTGQQARRLIDLDSAQSHLNDRLCPHALTCDVANNDFLIQHNYLSLNSICVSAIWYQCESRIEINDNTSDFYIVYVINGHCEVICNDQAFRTSAGEFFVINANDRIRASVSQDFQEILLKVSGAFLASTLTDRLQRYVDQPVRFQLGPTASTGEAASLGRFIELFCTEIDCENSAFRLRHLAAKYEAVLGSLILECLPHSYSGWLEAGGPIAIPYYVLRAERHIHANIAGDLRPQVLADLAGVSLRSLHEGFRRFKDVSVMGYIKDARLQRARAMLLADDQRTRAIAETARSCGFEHMSKFAAAYKQRFGELPSETVGKRAP